ncbi:hypothetical protein J6590_044591 [Homalodisca vitripennis]|nr:hypothetical protein J6590_044591 [Homalodisca vitripennis]
MSCCQKPSKLARKTCSDKLQSKRCREERIQSDRRAQERSKKCGGSKPVFEDLVKIERKIPWPQSLTNLEDKRLTGFFKRVRGGTAGLMTAVFLGGELYHWRLRVKERDRQREGRELVLQPLACTVSDIPYERYEEAINGDIWSKYED